MADPTAAAHPDRTADATDPTSAVGTGEPASASAATPASKAPAPAGTPARRISPTLLLGGLAIALVIAVIVSVGSGAYHIAPGDILSSIANRAGLRGLLGHLGIHVGPVQSPLDPIPGMGESVLWDIRLPRVVLAVIVGGSLAAGGAAMQGSFSNPLAEPGIVGVSSGAAFGAAMAIALGMASWPVFSAFGIYTTSIAAFIGGLVTVAFVYLAGRSNGRTEVVTLILAGVALNALIGAVIGLILHFSDAEELQSITFWNLGSVSNATWTKVLAVAPLSVIGLVTIMAVARQLDLLALGERSARHLGVNIERLRVVTLIAVAVVTAAATAVSGVILFVGLVVPHLVRMVAGPAHRVLIPACALGGGLLLVLADLFARTVANPQELPLGVLTSLVGSPVFFWMLRRTRTRQGGWA